MRVLFVCSGNICRSAMAAAYFRHHARLCSVDDLEIDSAGTLNIDGSPASVEAIEVMREIGIDLGGHRSRGIGPDDVHRADWIVAMTHGHLEELAQRFPGGGATRVLLRAFEAGTTAQPDPSDLDDPMGRPVGFYREQLPVLTRCLDHFALHLGLGR